MAVSLREILRYQSHSATYMFDILVLEHLRNNDNHFKSLQDIFVASRPILQLRCHDSTIR